MHLHLYLHQISNLDSLAGIFNVFYGDYLASTSRGHVFQDHGIIIKALNGWEFLSSAVVLGIATLQKMNSCFNPVLVTSVSCLCALHH